jgi:hypothetical protein
VPKDVEKVAVCRLSGARAGDRCREAPVIAAVTAVSNDGTLAASSIQSRVAERAHGGVPAAEPVVYEDLFPIGTVPPDTCTLHDDAAVASATPLVDAALVAARPASAAATGAAIRHVSAPDADAGR